MRSLFKYAIILRIEFDQNNKRIKAVKALPIEGAQRLIELSIALVNDKIYMSGANSLYLYNSEIEQFVKVDQAELVSNSLTICSHDRWVFVSQAEGIYCYDTVANEGFYTSLGFMPTKLQWLNNGLWISSQEGLYKCYFDLDSRHLERLVTIDNYENIFTMSIVGDRSGGVWLGFTKVGI